MAASEQRTAGENLEALRRRRKEIEAWLDGPVKKATLTAIDLEIAERERQRRSVLYEPVTFRR